MSERWNGTNQIGSKSYTCGYCGFVVASADGYFYEGQGGERRIYICSHCKQPTYFRDQSQVPGVAPGAEVASVPDDIAKLYREARNCIPADASELVTFAEMLLKFVYEFPSRVPRA